MSKKGLILMNSVGVIDNSYRGEIFLNFFKSEPKGSIQVGDRVAQLVPRRYAMVALKEVSELTETARGTGGFGSTGV